MSRFSPCRSLTLEGVCRDCACDCAMRSHSLMRVTGQTISCQVTDKSVSPKGVNLIKDPGFENYLTQFTPPYGNALPTRAHDTPAKQPAVCPCDVQFMDTTPSADWLCGGVGHSWKNNYGAYNTSKYWYVTNVNPRSGTYHARRFGTDYPMDLTVQSMVPTWGYDALGTSLVGYSGACNNGDLITVSGWGMASVATGAFEIFIEAFGSDALGGPAGSGEYGSTGVSVPHTQTASYEQAVLQYVPTGFTPPVYFLVEFYSSTTGTIDIDDCSLVIT